MEMYRFSGDEVVWVEVVFGCGMESSPNKRTTVRTLMTRIEFFITM